MALPTRSIFICATLLALSLGCQGGGEQAETQAEATSTSTSTGTETGTADPLGPTFWQDVAPIYYERCVNCHSEGAIGPFALDSYEAAASSAELSAEAVEAGVMPPWSILDDGSCNDWQYSQALSEAEIATIRAWVEAGTPEGEPRDDLEPPSPPALTGLTTLTTPEFFPEPQGGPLIGESEYRCFMIDPGLSEDMFLTGYQVEPQNPALVHHVIAASFDPAALTEGGLTNLESLTALDAESPDRLGWPCYAIDEGASLDMLPVVWGPGQAPVELPANSGALLPAGRMFIVQVHYNLELAALLGQSDSTSVGLRLAPEVEVEGRFDVFLGLIRTLLLGEPYAIPGGEAAHEFTTVLPGELYGGWIGNEPLDLWGFFPHMHERGVSVRARVLDGQGEEVACLGEVPRYDFDWQHYYLLEQPIPFETDYKVELTCTYDTSEDAGPTLPGWGTNNEMCFMGLYLTRR